MLRNGIANFSPKKNPVTYARYVAAAAFVNQSTDASSLTDAVDPQCMNPDVEKRWFKGYVSTQ